MKPWDWCLQSVLRKSQTPPEPVDVESAAAWLRHRFLYEGKFDYSEEASIIFKESKRRESVNGEWPRMPLTMFNAMLFDLVKQAHIDPVNYCLAFSSKNWLVHYPPIFEHGSAVQ